MFSLGKHFQISLRSFLSFSVLIGAGWLAVYYFPSWRIVQEFRTSGSIKILALDDNDVFFAALTTNADKAHIELHDLHEPKEKKVQINGDYDNQIMYERGLQIIQNRWLYGQLSAPMKHILYSTRQNSLETEVQDLVLIANDKSTAVCMNDGNITVVSLKDEPFSARSYSRQMPVEAIGISQDGLHVAEINKEHVLSLKHSSTTHLITDLQLPSDNYYKVLFSEDKSHIVVQGNKCVLIRAVDKRITVLNGYFCGFTNYQKHIILSDPDTQKSIAWSLMDDQKSHVFENAIILDTVKYSEDIVLAINRSSDTSLITSIFVTDSVEYNELYRLEGLAIDIDSIAFANKQFLAYRHNNSLIINKSDGESEVIENVQRNAVSSSRIAAASSTSLAIISSSGDIVAKIAMSFDSIDALCISNNGDTILIGSGRKVSMFKKIHEESISGWLWQPANLICALALGGFLYSLYFDRNRCHQNREMTVGAQRIEDNPESNNEGDRATRKHIDEK